MAEENPLELDTPWRRDLGEVGPALERWARAVVGADARVANAAAPGNGMSSETLLFDIPNFSIDPVTSRAIVEFIGRHTDGKK